MSDRRMIICEPCGHECPDVESVRRADPAQWSIDDYAEAAYSAYRATAQERSLVTGGPMLDWTTMRRTRPDVAAAWASAANAVRSMTAGQLAAQVARDAEQGLT